MADRFDLEEGIVPGGGEGVMEEFDHRRERQEDQRRYCQQGRDVQSSPEFKGTHTQIESPLGEVSRGWRGAS